MVLSELHGKLTRALRQLDNETIIDEKVLNDCLNEITRALLQSDVQFSLVRDLQINIKRTVNLGQLAHGYHKRNIIRRAVEEELCKILDSGKTSYVPKKGNASVVLFVGLQGSGKTTTCTKYAQFYRKKGFKPALVCADTFRAGAYDQLKQNAMKANVPIYGSHTESDPVQIAVEGVDSFRKKTHDLIIVDTSGRHKQEEVLFEEMRQISVATNPDLVIFVMDSSIGQATYDQALAFKQSVAVGAVIITKMDGHAKGGGALSAVAATKSPVIFIGTGEHMDDFKEFDVKPFVLRLLGMGDISGFTNKVHELVAVNQQHDFMQRLSDGNFTLRNMYQLFQSMHEMGLINEVSSMLAGLAAPKGHEKESQLKFKRFMIMMDSMTNEELDSSNPKLMNKSRILRIARGSGHRVEEMEEMMEKYKLMATIPKRRDMSAVSQNRNSQRMIPPQMLNHISRLGGLKDFMKMGWT
ncbi:hypothetical protein DCAR_0831320 [Daucus carota subsp. sativus]|uniref:Signal recognition particle 54 kDa protein n=1 Tax=Daucus carota subsp. sativus TaxID=79200 RepID=A0A175YNT5_DAUCS|nr:PREDICTED: signal recognition particle 54 kDa protein 2-like [Daucus carota subsp. sativus]WOH11826.1 hypothetical protein DCAR_0831320 [Daucus carota subsp. sativus]